MEETKVESKFLLAAILIGVVLVAGCTGAIKSNHATLQQPQPPAVNTTSTAGTSGISSSDITQDPLATAGQDLNTAYQ